MALVTRITRDSQPMKIPWGWWHVERIAETINTEKGEDKPLFQTLNACPYTVTQEHTFTDPADGEVLHLQPGDVLDAWMDR